MMLRAGSSAVVQMSCSLGLGLLLSKLYEEHFRCVIICYTSNTFGWVCQHKMSFNKKKKTFLADVKSYFTIRPSSSVRAPAHLTAVMFIFSFSDLCGKEVSLCCFYVKLQCYLIKRCLNLTFLTGQVWEFLFPMICIYRVVLVDGESNWHSKLSCPGTQDNARTVTKQKYIVLPLATDMVASGQIPSWTVNTVVDMHRLACVFWRINRLIIC